MAWTVELFDRATDTLIADITPYCLQTKVSARLNRPLAVEITIPGDTASVAGTWTDSRAKIEVGTRALKVKQSGTLRGHVIVWNFAPAGDENNTSFNITGYDPMMLLRRRIVQEVSGTFADPHFVSPISGAEIIEQAINNTIANDGALPIDMTGAIASSADMSADLTNWPTTIADLISQIVDTGQVDLQMLPVDSSGFAAGIMAQLTVADSLGSDLHATVHFDYGTGDYSLSNVRRSFDMDELCNKLWYYLGQRQDSQHYPANITGTETGPTLAAPYAENLAAYQTLQLASRAIYGVLMDVRQFDISSNKYSADWADALKLFHHLWRDEVTLRVDPRELLYITPSAGTGCPFRPFVDYNVGDVVAVNAAAIIGPVISGASQRIYGFDVNIDPNGVERVSELISSADGL